MDSQEQSQPTHKDSSQPSHSNRVSFHESMIRHLSILSLLIFFSIWGTLTREGLVALNSYNGMSIKPLIWPQAVGCLVMGWAIGNQRQIEKRSTPLYTGITTGYCGSVTTFSSWILQVFQAFGDQQHFHRGGLHNVMDARTQTAATLGMSIISLQAGMALAEFLKFEIILTIVDPRRWIRRDLNLNRSLDSSRITESHSMTEVDINNDSKSSSSLNSSSLFIISLGPIFWIASAFLCGFKPSFRKVTFSILFSPPGAISRWYLSRFNNSTRSKRFPFFPLGTLSANLLATLLISILFLCQNFGGENIGIGSNKLTCQVLYGLQEGFCGCLSTISTFAVELTKLKPKRKAVGYAFSSWFLGILICVLVIGIPWWTKGMDGSCKDISL